MPISTTYTISNTQGSLIFQLTAGSANGPNELAQSTDLTFYGYGRTGWGQQVDQNFYSLLENFACMEVSPGVPKSKTQLGGVLGINDPVVGQQWFNLSSNEMYVCSQVEPAVWRHLLSETYADTKYLSITNATSGAGAFVKLDGSNSPMTGLLVLSGDPTSALHPATKQYVDTAIGASSAGFVSKVGDTMTGALHVTAGGTPAASLSVIASNANVSLGSTASATTPHIDFNSSANNNDYDSRIIASGGIAGIGTGTLQLIGYIVNDGRAPTLANELISKSWLESYVTSTGGAFVLKSGSTMTGLLTLSGNPVNNNHAATKQYVDTFLPKTGGTLTGALTLAANPTLALHAATKQYVDSTISPTPTAQQFAWTDQIDVATAPYNNVFTAIKTFVVDVPANANFMMVTSATHIEHKSHALTATWRIRWNGVTMVQAFSEGNGDSSIGWMLPMNFNTSVTPGGSYTLTIEVMNRSNSGNIYTNRGQITTSPTYGNIGVSVVDLVFFK